MSAILDAAIENQLNNRCWRNAEGALLCRSCLRVVPEERCHVIYNSEDETKVWGPYCCGSCEANFRVCSVCGMDHFASHTRLENGVCICNFCR